MKCETAGRERITEKRADEVERTLADVAWLEVMLALEIDRLRQLPLTTAPCGGGRQFHDRPIRWWRERLRAWIATVDRAGESDLLLGLRYALADMSHRQLATFLGRIGVREPVPDKGANRSRRRAGR